MSRMRSRPEQKNRGGVSGMTVGLIALLAVAVAIGLGYLVGKALMGGGNTDLGTPGLDNDTCP